MRPLYHPSLNEISVEGILYALSDPVRVRIFADLVGSQCAQICSRYLSLDNLSIPKSTLSLHFKVLREAGLIRSERRGVELLNTPRCNEIGARFKPLVLSILDAYQVQEQQRSLAEEPAATEPATWSPPFAG